MNGLGAYGRIAVVLVLVLALAACGGGETASEPATTEAPATTTPAETGGSELPAIVVEAPQPDAVVTSPLTVSGTANVFEANVTVIIKGANGDELARDFTTATCGTGCRGDYQLELSFSVTEQQPGTIVVQDDDAAGTGTPPHVVQVPVTLAP